MRWDQRAADRSFDIADGIVVNNEAEFAFIASVPRWREKVRLVPLGIGASSALNLGNRSVSLPPPGGGTVSFVGHWSLRKGSGDWADLIRRVRTSIPSSRFLFAGTDVSAVQVKRDLGLPGDCGIEVWERFAPNELASVLSGTHVGVFPSYVEGFGLAVIEQLAAGIPVIAYDIPGPRDILGSELSGLLVPAGNVGALASKVEEVLTLRPEEYLALSSLCREVSLPYCWRQLAPDVADYYQGL